MAQYDDVNSKSITLMGIYSALITLVTIIGCQVLYFAMRQRQDENKLMKTEYTASNEWLDAQRASLQKYGKESREDGAKTNEYLLIPIDEAVKAVIREKGTGDVQKPKTEA